MARLRRRARPTDTDPLALATQGTVLTGEEYDNEMERPGARCSENNLQAREEGNYQGLEGGWNCSRTEHPPNWQHIALSMREVLGVWQDETEIAAEEAETDPAPEGWVPKVSDVVRRATTDELLFVVGFRVKGASAEVIDLDHQRFRVVKTEKLRPRKEGEDLVIKEDQAKWLARYLTSKRNETRDVAIKQMNSGYFKSVQDLNQVLEELKLAPVKNERKVRITTEFFVTVTDGADNQVVQRKLTQYLQARLPHGLEMEPRLMREVYVNVNRR